MRGADLVFACIGPALERFSRFRRAETADGREITLAEFLDKVWEVVGRAALAQAPGTAEAQAPGTAEAPACDGPSTGSGFHSVGALEEDARLTALFLWTLHSALNGNGRDGAPAPASDPAPPLQPLVPPATPDTAHVVASPPVAAAPPPTLVPAGTRTIRLTGAIPSEAWNRLGTRLITKLRIGESVQISEVDRSS